MEKILTWAALLEGLMVAILAYMNWHSNRKIAEEREAKVKAENQEQRAKRALRKKIVKETVEELSDEDLDKELDNLLDDL